MRLLPGIFIICCAGYLSLAEKNIVNIKIEALDTSTNEKLRYCSYDKELSIVNELKGECNYIKYSCKLVGERSEASIKCTNHNETLEELVEDGGFVQQENNIQYTVKLNRDEDSVWCMGSFKYDEDEELCGCVLQNLSTLHHHYQDNQSDFVKPGQNITIICDAGLYFDDYTQSKTLECTTTVDLAIHNCQSKEDLKEFDNKVAHFEGSKQSFVLVDEPFTQELSELSLCFWLRTKDAVGSIFSLKNEDHWNALRFDTHTSHVHFTMVGLHTDHGYVPPIRLVDDEWRYFCAIWSSYHANATVFLRRYGDDTDKTEEYNGNVPLSKGKVVRATGGKLALGNLWKEDVYDDTFNEIGSLEGDVMGLTLFNVTVDRNTFNKMFDECSTVIEEKNIVLSWKDILSTRNQTQVSATFGQQVCSKSYSYGQTVLQFPMSSPQYNLSNNIENYAKVDNAFSIDLTELTLCAMVRSDVVIGTIFSYVVNTPEFKEEIVLEKHKTHMHFYMAGIDQQVGAVPQIAIGSDRWYSTCFTWDSSGRWRGYLDGKEVTDNATAKLEYTIGKKISGGGTCYLGILKTFLSFREYRGYAGNVTELNLWGKALNSEQISGMVKRNKVYSENLLVSWGVLIENARGSIKKTQQNICSPPKDPAGTGYTKVSGNLNSTLFLKNDKVKFYCKGASVMDMISSQYATKTCSGFNSWIPSENVKCQKCEAAGKFECPNTKCIEKDKVCDGKRDCPDNEDELYCSDSDKYYIIMGVIIGILILLVPLVLVGKRIMRAKEEMARVKKLTDNWEVKRDHLELQEKLGEGAFGKVFKGKMLMKPDFSTVKDVAVKELSDIAGERDKNMFLEEIRLSKKLGNHPNIVGIVGAIIVYEPYCLILEFVDGGDLLEFVQKNKNEAVPITQEDQVFFSWQIANGMEYVSAKNFVHRDLAARNILISTSKRLKVTDFGLARDLYNYDEYQSEGGRLPIKWMSPEAIFELKFTTESDVWSYGILLYELFSWGGTPYPGIEPAKLRDKLVSGFRMNAPDGTPDFIYSIMLKTWEFKADARPSFKQIRTCVEKYIKDFDGFKRYQDEVLIEYGQTATSGTEDNMCSSDRTPLVVEFTERSNSTEYKNVEFKNSGVVTYNPSVKHSSNGASETAEVTVHKDDASICHRPVNVGFIDDNGIAELGRSEYMNT